MVGFEKISKGVLGLGAADPAFIGRGEENFARFAAVLNESLRGRNWLAGGGLTIADFSIGAWVPAAERLQLPVGKFSQIARWYGELASLPAWRASMVS
jgi:glutathione S-transferase